MNGVKHLLSALLTAIAVVVYATGNLIDGQYRLLLAIMAIFGGYMPYSPTEFPNPYCEVLLYLSV